LPGKGEQLLNDELTAVAGWLAGDSGLVVKGRTEQQGAAGLVQGFGLHCAALVAHPEHGHVKSAQPRRLMA
jgi:hypothetical protein